MPTGSGETVAETLNWKKPNCVSACDSVPRECRAISACPPPPPKLLIGPCPPQAQWRVQQQQQKQQQQQQQQRSMETPRLIPVNVVDPCNTKCPYLAAACPSSQRPQRQQQQQQQHHYSAPTRREDGILGFVGGPQTMASVALVPMERPQCPAPPKLMATVTSGRTEAAPRASGRTEAAPRASKYDCNSKTSRQCENNCPECPIEIHNRTIYPKCEAMVPGYGGHVPGITTCKFGKTFGRETREALQKVYSTPQLKTYPKKC